MILNAYSVAFSVRSYKQIPITSMLSAKGTVVGLDRCRLQWLKTTGQETEITQYAIECHNQILQIIDLEIRGRQYSSIIPLLRRCGIRGTDCIIPLARLLFL